MFNRIISSLDSSDLKAVGTILLTGFMYQGLGFTAAILIRMFTRVPKYWVGSLLLACVFSNTTDLPVAYVTTLSGGNPFNAADGAKGTAYSMVFVASFIFTMYNMGAYKLVQHDARKKEKAMKEGTYKVNDMSNPGIFDVITFFKQSSIFGYGHSGNEYPSEITSNDTASNISRNEKHSESNTPQVLTPVSEITQDELYRVQTAESISEVTASKASASLSTHHHHNHYSAPPLLSSQEPSPDGPDSVIVVYQDEIHTGIENEEANNGLERTTSRVREIKEINLREEVLRPTLTPAEQIQQGLIRIHSFNEGLRNRNGQLVDENGLRLERTTTKNSTMSLLSPAVVDDELTSIRSKSNVIFPHAPQTNDAGYDQDLTLTPISSQSSASNVSLTELTFSQKFFAYIESHYFLRVFVWPLVSNFARPPSAMLISSLVITMIPSLRALFYNGVGSGTTVIIAPHNIPNAPDGQPVLSFLMDLTSFVGNAQVPLNMFLLGASISRLKVNAIPPGFWKVVVSIAAFKLVILPIIAVVWTVYMRHLQWVDKPSNGDSAPMAGLMMIVTSGTPVATLQVLFITMYSKPILEVVEEKDQEGNIIKSTEIYRHEELDYLAVNLIFEYMVLFVSMGILLTYTLKQVLAV